VPLETLVRKFAHQRFEPSGFTKNPEIRNASSITDYVFRWMALQFIPGYRESHMTDANQPELAMPGLLEEIKKRINHPSPQLPRESEDTDIVAPPSQSVGATPQPVPGQPAQITSLNEALAHFQEDAPI
jgi:ribonucleoside-diphosphate reductase alpha chain